jgi:cyclophilin family peptidyl-prolyl cis-trans isomerase
MLRALLHALVVLTVSGGARSVQPADRPVLVVETARGTIEIELFPEDAPKSVAHVLELVNRAFYDGQRIHRALPEFLVQWGDPLSRDLDQRDLWGRHPGAGSGQPIGLGEVSKKRRHLRGSVGLAHTGDPRGADSQIYITLSPQPRLDQEHTIIGQVVAGDEVPDRLKEGDVIRTVSVKAAKAPS